MLNKFALNVALAGLLVSLSGTASALGDQWYFGVGGGISQLQPDTVDTTIDVRDQHDQVGTVFFGRDFDNRSSGQFQLYSLGEAEYSDGQSKASYTAGDASLLYRFYDSRDRLARGTIFGTSLYGRFGFGFMRRDSDLSLDSDTPAYFGAGAGIEMYLSFNLAMRLEALYHDKDVGSAMLTLVNRFGGRTRVPANLPSVPTKPATPDASTTTETAITSIAVQENSVAVPTDLPETYEVAPERLPDIDAEAFPDVKVTGNTTATQKEPAETLSPTDSDADGVMGGSDQCPDSAPGYPVTSRGCPVFGGMLPDLTFNDRTASPTSGSYAVLEKLVQQLNDYPTTYIELVAHTDNNGTESEQSDLTQQRLRTVGVYLVRNGINQNRLLLRSYGGSRPAFDNSTADGRRRNNRIEIFENP